MIRLIKILNRLSSLVYLTLFLGGIVALGIIGLFFVVLEDLPQIPSPLERVIETPPTEFFSASGERVLILGGKEAVSLSSVSIHLIKAIVATEDHRFWDHHGVDKVRTLKALWVTLFEPGRIQGASTITQQLAKNLFFSFEQTYLRKFREMLVALQIESQYSKSDILEAYLNQIPFGSRAHGVEQAAGTFFNKPASELTLAESALIAGLPKSPTRYNPFRHLERAKGRQKVVLSRMVATGDISEKQATEAFGERLNLHVDSTGGRTGSYFFDHVIKQLDERYGSDVVYHGGLRVTTTFDPRLQTWASKALRNGLEKLDNVIGVKKRYNEQMRIQGALAAVETNSGAVKALVGGREYLETEFNRAVQSNRQSGSGFKPFVYYAALEKLGMIPTTTVVDQPVKINIPGSKAWEPKNFGLNYSGPMILKKALMNSVNSISAQLVAKTGPEYVVETARRCGFTSRLEPVYSIALGSLGASPLEMASSFATFASGGIHHHPFFIWRVEDALGRIIDEHIVAGQRTLETGLAYQMVDMMRSVVDAGTGRMVRRMGFDLPAAGKTGTTNKYKDAWFTGFTPTLSTSVWVGFDRSMGLIDANGVGITGGRGAAPIWADFMIHATAGDPPREFAIPKDIRFEIVNSKNGFPANESDPGALRVALLKNKLQKQTELQNLNPATTTIARP
jgi:1A family penicillin-binding protein